MIFVIYCKCQFFLLKCFLLKSHIKYHLLFDKINVHLSSGFYVARSALHEVHFMPCGIFPRNTLTKCMFMCAFHVSALHVRAFHAMWGFVRREGGGGMSPHFMF